MTKKDDIVKTATDCKVLPGLIFFIDVGKHDFISLYDKMFNTIDRIIKSNTNLLNVDVNTLSKNIQDYRETKQNAIMSYHNSQFHIFYIHLEIQSVQEILFLIFVIMIIFSNK